MKEGIKRNLYRFKSLFLSKGRNDPRTSRALVKNSSLHSDSIYSSAIHQQLFTNRKKKMIKRIELPTHYLEVNYRTLKAVMFYGPNTDHIPKKW